MSCHESVNPKLFLKGMQPIEGTNANIFRYISTGLQLRGGQEAAASSKQKFCPTPQAPKATFGENIGK